MKNHNSIIERHSSWLAINSIKGCNRGCKYCFLKECGLNMTKPKIMISPEESIKQLKEFHLYDENFPVAIFTHTDAFATKENETFLNELLKLIAKEKLPNPIVVVTKACPTGIIDEGIELMKKAQRQFIAYISYSGLKQDVERGINHDETRNAFKYFNNLDVPIVHYWRPFLPENSTPEKLQEVLDYVSKYAKASVYDGLKVYDYMRNQIDFWPQLSELCKDDKLFKKIINCSSIFPFKLEEFFNKIKIPNNYPIFKRNVCALNYILNKTNTNGFYKNNDCLKYSKCPCEFREKCKCFYEKYELNDKIVQKAFKKFNLGEIDFKITKKNDIYLIKVLNKTLSFAEISTLRAYLSCEIECEKNENDGYWASATSGAKEMFIEDIKNNIVSKISLWE
ncbi:MAG TPA: radical SAM protein [Rickettsiales bacterium]|nr:radical SAM protein [Rickettsiales bacterium]